MPDRVLHSFNGPASNGETVDWRGRVVGGPEKPFAYDDALKFTSQLRDFVGKFGRVFSGKENCVDVNNKCRNVTISGEFIANGGLYPITVKGGSEGITITGTLDGHGTEVDVDAGNWSDQSNSWVKNWTLQLTTTDGSPVVVRCLQAEAPTLLSGPYRYAFPSPKAWYHGIAVWFLQLWWKLTK